MSENSAHNKQGAKGYRDYIISQLDKDFETETFPASDETIVKEATESYTKDMAKTDFTADGSPKSNPEISHLHTASKHSFEHSFDSETTKQGTDSGRTPKFAKTDDTATKDNRETY